MRTFSRVCVVFSSLFVWALAAATASAQDVLYLRAGAVLSATPPAAGATTAVISKTLPAGEDALLGSFASEPFDHEVVLGQVRSLVYLGTGRPGMDGCAVVTTSLVRLTGQAQSTVASGTLETSILPRRQVIDPIVVPMPLVDPLVAAAGDRVIFEVRVANQCGGERRLVLLYDSVGRASAVELYAPGATTSTTTTTLVGETTSTSTTTLPPTCLETATGLALVRCRLETMDGIIRGSSPAMLGGPRFKRRLERRIDRALTSVRAAELIEATPRRVRKGRRQVVRFLAQLSRGQGNGRVAREVGDPLAVLAQGAMSGLDAILVGG